MSANTESGFSREEVLNIRFPLHRACRDGDVGALCSLIQGTTNLADLVAEDSFYGWTPIHWAAHFGKLECVMRLVQVGCCVNAVTSKFGQTPTHISAFGGHPECLLWLLQAGADINSQDYVGETPVHKAGRAGSVGCINALLASGAAADLRNSSGLTAADVAHAQGFLECAQLLSNSQNQLHQFCPNGAPNAHHPHSRTPSLPDGTPSRKRSLDCMESNHLKKARIDGSRRAWDKELENMQTETSVPPHEILEKLWFSTSGIGYRPHLGGGEAAPNGDVPAQRGAAVAHVPASGSLHHGDGPSGCASQRPAQHMALGDSLHHGHYPGFCVSAEDILAASSQEEHGTTVKAEQLYKHTVLSTMHLYHGS